MTDAGIAEIEAMENRRWAAQIGDDVETGKLMAQLPASTINHRRAAAIAAMRRPGLSHGKPIVRLLVRESGHVGGELHLG